MMHATGLIEYSPRTADETEAAVRVEFNSTLNQYKNKPENVRNTED